MKKDKKVKINDIIRLDELIKIDPNILTLPTQKIEYSYDKGVTWYKLATENYVNSVLLTPTVNNLSSSTTSYTLLTTDEIVIANNPGASVALTLPSSPSLGQQYTIIDGVGISSTFPITITSPNTQVYQTGISSAFNASVLTTLTGLNNPFKVAISPNGNYAYITNSGSNTVSIYKNASSGSPTLLTTINVGSIPSGVAITPDGNYAYVVNENNVLTVIQNASTDTPSILTTFTFTSTAFDVAISPNGNYVYVANRGSNSVTIIQNASSGNPSILTTLTVGNGPVSIAFTPNGNYVYVANYNASTISVIQNASTNSPTILSTITLTTGCNPYSIAITPNGNYAYIANNNLTTVTVLQNVSTNSASILSTTLTVGTGAAGITITPNGNYVYITNQVSNNVTVIQNASSGSPSVLSNPITVGNGAFGIAITSNGNYAYITNVSTTTVSVIKNVSGSSSATIATNYGQITLIYNGTSWDATASSGSSNSSADTFQTLTYGTSITWNANNGNVANLTLTGSAGLTINMGTQTKLVLIVKQDATGNRTLVLPTGVYRTTSSSNIAPLSTAANAIDTLVFRKDISNNIYLTEVVNSFLPIIQPTSKYIFDYTGSIQTLTIPATSNFTCIIKVLGAAGGQGVFNANAGFSGAGGYTLYQFNTSNYVGQQLQIIVGQGGAGGDFANSKGGLGGYPNGGNGFLTLSSGSGAGGGGGGRSDVRIGTVGQSFSSATILAIAGAGGGGFGNSLNAGAGGGSTGQNDSTNISTGGTQTAAGFTPTGPTYNQQGAQFLGAGCILADIGQDDANFAAAGGGDGYFGGGTPAKSNVSPNIHGGGSGGSGYVNTTFAGYTSGTTYTGNVNVIPTVIASDTDLNTFGAGVNSVSGNVSGIRGGNGRVVIQFA